MIPLFLIFKAVVIIFNITTLFIICYIPKMFMNSFGSFFPSFPVALEIITDFIEYLAIIPRCGLRPVVKLYPRIGVYFHKFATVGELSEPSSVKGEPAYRSTFIEFYNCVHIVPPINTIHDHLPSRPDSLYTHQTI